MKYASANPATEVRFTSLIQATLHIPAGAADYKVDQTMTINRDVTIWRMLPHTHVRGKGWSYEAVYPDGRTETILAVPMPDFNGQTDYVFKHPLKLPKGTTIHATARYDNSANNPSTPIPPRTCGGATRRGEEMMFTGLTYSVDVVPSAATAPAAVKH